MTYFPPAMVNANQDPEERRRKYAYLRASGLNSYEAMKLRDWRWDYIDWFIDRWVARIDPEETFSQIRTRLSQAGQA